MLIKDLDLARQLGLSNPSNIRVTIRALKRRGLLGPLERCTERVRVGVAVRELWHWLLTPQQVGIITAQRRPVLRANRKVYFIRCLKTKRIRVAWAVDPDRQLRLLRRMSPTGLELLGAWLGSKEDKARIMERFGEHQHHAEWLRPSPELVACADGRPDWLPQGARWRRKAAKGTSSAMAPCKGQR